MTDIPILHGSEIDGMREAGRLAAECLSAVAREVAIGVNGIHLDEVVQAFCADHKTEAATLGYNGFPAHCCVSVNHVVAHGVPNERRFRSGDLVKVDLCLRTKDGWHGDTCATFFVGKPSVKGQMVTDAAHDTLHFVLRRLTPELTTGDIGWFINHRATRHGFPVVQEYGGHGIGKVFHGLPMIPNVGVPNQGTVLLPGMCITIEPMLNVGERYIKMLSNGALVTRDRSLSAQFEHTVLITEDGCEILTVCD